MSTLLLAVRGKAAAGLSVPAGEAKNATPSDEEMNDNDDSEEEEDTQNRERVKDLED